MDSNTRISIIGAGLMGHGLALVHAQAGHQVTLQDISATQLTLALDLIRNAMQTMADTGHMSPGDIDPIMGRIHTAPTLEEAVEEADMVIEVVVENVEVKTQVYQQIEAAAKPDAIMVSNTSYLDVFPLIPAGLQKRSAITHWYTPPYIIDLVDIAPGPETDPSIPEALNTLYQNMGKKPVLFKRFIPGYVANRLQSAMALEISHLIDDGWATADDIDTSIKYGLALRMATMGALMKADFTGLDMTQRAMANMTYYPPEPKPNSPTLDAMIAEGKQGVMNGSGYFDYGDMSPTELFRNRDIGLLRMKAEVDSVEKDLPLKPE